MHVIHKCFPNSYLVRPSPFSAQKTFERHNSRRKSNISFCSNLNMAAAAAAAAAASSRRGSGFNLNQMQSGGCGGGGVGSGGVSGYGCGGATGPLLAGGVRGPPLVTIKANSLSLPDSPSMVGQTRARSNSLRVSVPWSLKILHQDKFKIISIFDFLLRSTTTFCCGAPIRCAKDCRMSACPDAANRRWRK